MLRRKIITEIERWYQESTSGLLIDGARQVGKTTAIREFLNENHIKHVEFNLLENHLVKEAFDTSFDADQLFLKLTSLMSDEITENSVIFIDEIQEAHDAITPIKFLVQNTRYKYIFSGSLLGIKMKDIESLPVGYLTIRNMYPLDLEEFLWANKVSSKIIDYLKECFENLSAVDDTIHKQMLGLFHIYLAVGGMPKAVSDFIEEHDLRKVNEALMDIDSGYRKDITKYDKDEKLQIQEIYDLIPSELNAQNKRFILKNMNEKARFYQYEKSFTWVKNSGIGLFVHNVDNPVYPLLASKERTLFKLFLSDVGLLTYKLYNGNQISILNGNSTLNYGAIYEAFIAVELNSHGFSLFYNNDKKRGEIDFLIEKDQKIIPILVKSGKDYKRHSALSNLLSNDSFGYDFGYVFCNENIEKKAKTIYLPIYMVMFLNEEKMEEDQKVTFDISKLI